MSPRLQKRQHTVKIALERPGVGEAFNDVLIQIIRLNRHFTTAAEGLTKPAGQTLARWLVLGECKDAPATVSEVARRLRLARQSVQRVADVLEGDGLCSYRDNPQHQRAKLLELTPAGRSALTQIEEAQRKWSDALGARIGKGVLQNAHAALIPVLDAVERAGEP